MSSTVQNLGDISHARSIASSLSQMDSKVIVRPWLRFGARGIDNNLASAGLGIILTIWWPRAFIEWHLVTMGMVALFGWTFVEALLLSTVGTTPGKWLFAILVRSYSGQRPTFAAAFGRALDVWFRGMAMGLPLFNIITMMLAYTRLERERVTGWDYNGDFLVSHGPVSIIRGALAVLVIVGFLYLNIVGLRGL